MKNSAHLSRKEREHLRHREEILKAALSLFAEKGFHGTTMQDIAEVSEFSVGTLYNFFRNKEEIYDSLILDVAEEFHQILNEILDGKGSETERIQEVIAAKIDIFRNHLKQMRIYFAETQGATFNVKAGLDSQLRGWYEEYLQKLARVFRSGIRKKIFCERDPYLLALALDGISTAFLVESMDHPGERPFDAGTVLGIFFHGVFRRKENGK